MGLGRRYAPRGDRCSSIGLALALGGNLLAAGPAWGQGPAAPAPVVPEAAPADDPTAAPPMLPTSGSTVGEGERGQPQVAQPPGAAPPSSAPAPEVTPTATPSPAHTPRGRAIVEPPRGRGLQVGGGLLLGLIGAPLLFAGSIGLAIAVPCARADGLFTCNALKSISVGYLVGGALGTAGGATMLVFGTRRNRVWKQWKADNWIVWQPAFGATPDRTPTAGVRLRF